jgi:exopolysaccharide biosynthesis polyprenyl glycosylphosphotransferase
MLTAHIVEPGMWARTRFLVDVLMLTLAASAAVFAAPDLQTGPNRVLAAVFPLVAVVTLHIRRDRDERLQVSMIDTGTAVIGAVSSAAIVTMALATVVGAVHPVALTLRLWLFAIVYAGVARAMLASVRAHATSNRALAVPTLIVGAGSVGELIVKRISEDPRYGLRPVGFLDAAPMPTAGSGIGRSAVPVLGAESDLRAAVALTGARRVILAFSAQGDHELIDQIRACQQLGVDVSLVPRLFESINERATLDHVGGLALLSLRPTDPRGWEFAIKHALDRGVALLALIVAAPLMAVIALAVRLTSPGQVLFRQRRIGRDGQVFNLLKFRTMFEAPTPVAFEPQAGCAPGGVEGEDRRTPFGRWLRDTSLDELPQLINVLRGEMSLVGPRPERPEFVKRFAGEVTRYEDRHRVKSGITGWAQVNGLRGQTSIGDRVEWDNYYIRNWSLRLDLRILALTLVEILRWRDSATSRPGYTEEVHSPPRPRRSADS